MLSQGLVLDIFLLLLVAATAIAVITVRSLFAATILAGIYSLLMALVWTNMHALDVAFTEASVGAGISTILLLGALVQTKRFAKREHAIHPPALLVCLVTGMLLIYGTFDMPRFGTTDAPINQGPVAQEPGCFEQGNCPKSLLYQNIGKDKDSPLYAPRSQGHAHHGHPQDDFNGHVPNTVTSLLAAYRGYDTMFETTVIFVAGISMLLLLRRRREGEPGVPASSPAQRNSETASKSGGEA